MIERDWKTKTPIIFAPLDKAFVLAGLNGK